jgi:hypothetical protein
MYILDLLTSEFWVKPIILRSQAIFSLDLKRHFEEHQVPQERGRLQRRKKGQFIGRKV